MKVTPYSLYCRDAAYSMRELPGRTANTIITAPPSVANRGGYSSQTFDDSFRWNPFSAARFAAFVESGGPLANTMQALEGIHGRSDELAYAAFTAEWLLAAHHLLADSGSIYVICDVRRSRMMSYIMDAVFGIDGYRDEITWLDDTPHSGLGRYGTQCARALHYVKGLRAAPYSRSSIPAVHYSTQHMLELLISASSNPGDLVCDPFASGGAVGATALKLKRRFLGIDPNAEALSAIQEKLTRMQQQEAAE
ncbi:MAG: DNA methyltransferase [Hyphomicrobiaceae bacterium]